MTLSMKRWLVGIVIVAAICILSYLQCSNQLRPLVPWLYRAPVIPELPDLMADLRGAKSKCESASSQLKELARQRRLQQVDLNKASTLYSDAKAASDSCIEFLRAGLERRFNDDDPAKIKTRMIEVGAKMTAFTAWANTTINNGDIGAGDPLADAITDIFEWVTGVSKANDEAVQRLRADLEACRLKEWKDIK